MFFLRSSTVTSIMQKLENEGLIERYLNKNDKRMKRIRITQKGYQVYHDVGNALSQLDQLITKNWTSQEKEIMMRLMDGMIQQFCDCKE